MAQTQELADIALSISLTQARAVVVGAPGSGKTTQLRRAVLELETRFAPDRILVLTPSRSSAASLRDEIALASARPSSRPRARSISSYAFELITRKQPELRLLSGPNQQDLIQSLIAEAKGVASWGINPKAVGLSAFAQELRDLLQVVLEFEISTPELQRLAEKFPNLKLAPLIELLPKYQESLALQQFVDPSSLLTKALEMVDGEFDFVLVDDAQNLSAAGLRLLTRMADFAPLIAFGDPDSAVQGFRAAEPGEFLALGELQFLNRSLPQPALVQSVMAKVAAKLPPAGAGRQRAVISASPVQVPVPIFQSTSAEADYLAARLRRTRLEKQIPFNSMAVVVRTQNQADQLSRELSARSVPVRNLGAGEALSHNQLTRSILETANLALSEIDLESLRAVLLSSFVGFTPIELRRLERQLVFESGLTIAQAWEEAMVSGFEFESREARRLSALVQLLSRVRSVAITSAHQLISLIWDFAPKQLREIALGDSEVALAANRDIDAVLRLFAAAERFDEREASSPIEFVRQQLRLTIAEDSLASRLQSDAVVISTASGMPESSFEVVAIPRLQDGIWPNLKPRNSLLGAAALRAFYSGRIDSPDAPLRNELADETRLFYKAISISRGELWFSAMQSADEQPSQFFYLMGAQMTDEDRPVDFDLRRLVGRLRQSLRQGNQSAAGLLAGFALAGIQGAEPSSWQGLLQPSTVGAIFNADEDVFLSPSSLQAFQACPLHWFVKTFAVGQTSFQASIGTLLHAAFELAARPEDVVNYLESKWHTLEFENAWESQSQRRRAVQMATLAANYLQSNPNPAAIEQGFELEFGRLKIRGQIDRVERTAEGLVVADLKTGKSSLDASDNLQLAVYQLAVSKVFPEEKVAGGQLISVGSGKLKISKQAPLDGEALASLYASFESFEHQVSQPAVLANFTEHCGQDGNCRLLLARQVIDG